METIVIVGGSKSAAEFLESQTGMQVIHHDAYIKTRHGQQKFANTVKRAVQIVVIVDACSHQAMWTARTLAKEHRIPISYKRGLGMSGFLNSHQIEAFS